MKKLLLLLTALTFTLSGCSLLEKDQNLTITLLTGESYFFREDNVFPTIEPNSFIAQMRNNEVRGMHLGVTQMLVEAGNTTYNCIVDVQARNNIYTDMTIYFGQSRAMINRAYKFIEQHDGMVFYGPLGGITGLLEVQNAFRFENDRVVGCAIYFRAADAKIVLDHLSERYEKYSSPAQRPSFYGDSYNYEQSNLVIECDYTTDNLIYVAYMDMRYSDLPRPPKF